jgi:hypothetical protein
MVTIVGRKGAWAVRKDGAQREFSRRAEAEAFAAAARAVGTAVSCGRLVLLQGAQRCECRGCSAWLGDSHYYSDDRCNGADNGGAGLVLCEEHAEALATLDDATYTARVRAGAIRAGGRGHFRE